MKARITGKALVITSEIKVEDINRAKKICPEALELVDAEGNRLFSIDHTSPKSAGIGSAAINFDSETSGGHAQITLMMDKTLTKEELADKYGKDVSKKLSKKLSALEPQKQGIGAGGVFAIILGVIAAAGVLYAAWQTLRADDELWVADDPLRAPDA